MDATVLAVAMQMNTPLTDGSFKWAISGPGSHEWIELLGEHEDGVVVLVCKHPAAQTPVNRNGTTEGVKWAGVTIGETTLNWLDETLPTLDPHAPLVLLTHFPLASEVPMCPLNAEAVLAKFIGHNLRGVFGGHFHGTTRNPRGGVGLNTCACASRVRDNHRLAESREKGDFVVDGKADGNLKITFVEFSP